MKKSKKIGRSNTLSIKASDIHIQSPLDKEVADVRRKRRKKEAMKSLSKIITIRDNMRKRAK